MAEITLQQIAELMRQELAAVEDRMEKRLDAIDAKLAEHDAGFKEVVGSIHSLNKFVEEKMVELREDVKREVRMLTEQDEGRKIATLYEESQSHKETLDNHEKRIDNLEAAAG